MSKEVYNTILIKLFSKIECIFAFAFRKNIDRNKEKLIQTNFIKAGAVGLFCFGLLSLIIIFRIEI